MTLARACIAFTVLAVSVTTACSSTAKKALAPTPTSSAAAAAVAPTTAPSAAGGGATAAPSAAGSGAAASLQPANGGTVDGIACETTERLTYHVHAHLMIIDTSASPARAITVPALVGIVDNRCIYWLHTHDPTGVIHVEAPSPREFTLGQFFDIWGQPLDGSRAAGLNAGGGNTFRYFVDGKEYTGDPRQIPLGAHTQIVIEFGQNFVPLPQYTFPAGL